ncbi:hypothetical protein ACFLW6_03090 [Chloroflexota bacterium]
MLSDSLLTLTGPTGDGDTSGELEVGEIWTYTGSYIVQQSDLNDNGGGDGDIDNTATVSSDDLADESDSEEVPIANMPEKPKPPTVGAVGGEVFPVSKVTLLAPWIALALAIAAIGVLLVKRKAFGSK